MRRFVTLFVALAALATLPAERALSQSYPAKPIRLIVPQAAGGQSDAIARIVGQRLAEVLKQPVVIENHGGAGGTIGTNLVAKASPDGYTLLVGGSNTLALAPALLADLQYNPATDFLPLRIIVRVPYALAVNPRVPASTIAELVAHARNHPGRLTYGSSGNGSMSALAAELFKAEAGLDIVHVPYRGSGPAVTDLVGGQIDIMFADLALLVPHARAGTLRLVAAAAAKRASAAPELPTVAEQGFGGFDIAPWYAIAAPAGTPPAVAARLTQALGDVMRLPEVRQRFEQLGYEPADDPAPGLDALIRSDIAKFSAIIKSAGIKATP